MTPKEIIAQQLTDAAWHTAREEYDLEFYQKKDAVKQECDFCHKVRGIGYILFTEDNLCKCLYCREGDKINVDE